MKVLGIGESVIDKAYITANADAALDTLTSTTHVGGPSLIAMLLLSRLGVDCTLLTSLGRDDEAQIIRQTLRNDNVQVLAKTQKKTKVNTYTINPQTGARQKRRGNTIHNPIKNLTKRFLYQFDVILIDRHEKEAFYEIIQKKKPSTRIIIDPSTEVSQFTLDMIKYADYPVLPIESLTKIDDCRNLQLCLEKLYMLCGKTIIVTAGELGSIIFDGEHCDVVPPHRVEAIDVQGAGDIYRGGLAYGILKGWDIHTAATFGNLVAGLQCTRLGNASAIPTKGEIEKYHKQLNEKKLASIATHFVQLYE